MDVAGVIDTPLELRRLSEIVDADLCDTIVSDHPRLLDRRETHTQSAFFFPLHCEYW